MGKHEAPPFKMVVEGGKLVPATAYDAERLDTYRRGTKVSVRFTEEKDRVMVRKWFAILGLVVKQCNVPWQTKDEASEAIKLALGIVNLTKTVGGQFMQYPKSLTELTDPELDDAVRDMMDLIHRMTGIDPETLRKEAADVGADEEPSEASPPSDEGSAAGTASGAAEESAAREVEPGAGNGAEAEPTAPAPGELDDRGAVNSSSPPGYDFLKAEMVKKVLAMAGDQSLSVQERLENLDTTRPAWDDQIKGHPGLVRQVFGTAAKVIRGELPAAKARQYLETL